MYANGTIALAKATWKSFLREKIFYAVSLVSILILGFAYLLATLTIIETRKIMLDFGFSAISLSGVMIAVFMGVFSVSKEIETKTIYTVLSKPVTRTNFLLGKFLGCLFVLAASHAILGLVLASVVSLAGEPLPAGFTSCVSLIFLESTIVLSVAFFFSIVTKGFLAGSFTLAVFIIGRSSTSLMAMAEKGSTTEVKALAKALYWIAPNMERFNIRDVVAYGREFPHDMLLYGPLYTVFYSALFLAFAALLLDRKEIP